MTEAWTYLFIISLVLAVPIGLAIRTLLALEERVIVPLLRFQTAGGVTHAIAWKRTNAGVRQMELTRAYVLATSVKFIQPRSIS